MAKSLFTKGVLAHSPFRWFYLGRTISLFGSGMTPVALAFAILQTRHGQQLLGYILAAELLPNVLVVLIGGSVADRYRRDRLIQIANLGSGFSQACIAAVVLSNANPYWIFPLAIINGVLGAFTSPAIRGIVPELVDREDIKQANALLNTSRSASRIVGPAVAGMLVATVGGGWGIAFDALSFFIAGACMVRVRIPSHPKVSANSLIRQMGEGWEYFRHQRWIWSITGAWAVMNAVQMGAWQVLGPIIAKHTFGSASWGLTLSAKALGLLLASGMMLRLQFSRPLRDGMMAAAVMGIPMVVLGQGLPLPYLMMAAIVAGIGSTVSTISWDTSLQQGVPKDKLSRVIAFDEFGSYVVIPLGEILAVPVADQFGLHTAETWGGLIFIVVALVPLSLGLVRRMTMTDILALGRGEKDPMAQ
ncbi:MAG: MFS transporter [Sulfobacillus benefaciens]|uniref:MFS transporter n=1 Tax=Sulfobacillus benefaciens TaxID=453960 RepID=A0A2T2XEC4_9FIRM|nr:MAG: MFS transporter [Sulfobacillus benefaciens]